ncbi:MAG: hypothetical protein HY679_08330 [Chloroflexi bacterium]|nr:hypothetical protein [Chloroflexota bacterium]
MLSHSIKVELPEKEYRRLLAIARRRKRTVKALVKEAVEQAYLNPPITAEELMRLPAFGIWKDDPRTDEEILNDLGGNWSNFPLEKPEIG